MNAPIVAQTIADQIGRVAFVMMGAKNLLGSEDHLQFQIRGSKKVNRIVVKLEPSDTYTVKFYTGSALKIRQVAEVSDVYADSLRRVIESETGLYLSL